MNILEVEGLRKQYPGFLLDDVSFSLEPGYIMGFIGRNGAGKTTTLKSMLGLVHPDGGRVRILGRDFAREESVCKQQLGIVLGGFDHYKNKKLATITGAVRPFYPGWDETAYRRYLELFALAEDKRINQLSAGMAVKYALTLALSHGAKLLILDEPTSGLDPVSREELLQVFRQIIEDGEKSILFSTHITSDLDRCADYITYIRNGKIQKSCDKLTFTEEYRLVQGGGQPDPAQARALVGVHRTAFGYTGLIRAGDAGLFSAGAQTAPADVDSVMLYLEKEDGE